ncbi:MAG: hypothetical protein CMM01_09495 [Rhodopirellula sp.]|nr:hypothetical protein [Rhodopirellula sp.]OUX51502.1 MAG: hypothetical protein CBE43_03260 [Rhodopirellula sp. TMED283]
MTSWGIRGQVAGGAVRKGMNHRIVMIPVIGIGHAGSAGWDGVPVPDADSVWVVGFTLSSRMTF